MEPRGYTLALKAGDRDVSVFVDEEDMKALRDLGKSLAVVDGVLGSQTRVVGGTFEKACGLPDPPR